MKKILSLCVLLMAACHVHAQKQLPGYYVSNAHDTMQATFEYYPSEDNPAIVRCIANGVEKSLQPGNCLAFAIPGYVQFVSKQTKRMLNPTSIDQSPSAYMPQDVYENVNVFLKLIFTSPGYTLYEYHDAARVNYFLEDSASNFVELRYKITMNNSAVREHKVYLGQLQSLFYTQLEQNKKAKQYFDQLTYAGYDLARFLELITGYQQPEKQKVKYPKVFVSLNTGMVFLSGSGANVTGRTGGLCLGAGIGLIYYTGEVMESAFISPQIRTSTFQFVSSTARSKINAISTKIDVLCSAGITGPINRTLQWSIAAAPTVSVILTNGTEGFVGNLACNVAVQAGIVVRKKLCISVISGVFGTRMYSGPMNETIISQRSVMMNIDWRFPS